MFGLECKRSGICGKLGNSPAQKLSRWTGLLHKAVNSSTDLTESLFGGFLLSTIYV
jgi:hypothetical protein